MPIWKMNFCSRFFRLSVVPRCRERPQIAMCFLEWLGRLKGRATGLHASLSFFSTSRRCRFMPKCRKISLPKIKNLSKTPFRISQLIKNYRTLPLISSSTPLELRAFTSCLKFTNLTTRVALSFLPVVARPNSFLAN